MRKFTEIINQLRVINTELPQELLAKDLGLNGDSIKKKRDIERLFSDITKEAKKVS